MASNGYSTTTHGILTGDYVRIGKGTKLWYVEFANDRRVTVSRSVPRGHTHAWTELRRYLKTPTQIARLIKVAR